MNCKELIKMRFIIFGFVFTLFISSCASTNSLPILYQKYFHYKQETNKDNIIETSSKFFTASLLGSNYQTNPDASSQLLFKNLMVVTDSHYEKTDGKEGCLAINGFDEDGDPLVFSLKYTSVNHNWLIDDIHVVFVENSKEFTKSAKCPNEYPQQH